MHIEDDDEVLL